MDDSRADNHAKAVPLWVRQWHSREELAARFQVSVRTLHRHVNRGNIERRENLDGTSDYRPILNAWTLERLAQTVRGDSGDTGDSPVMTEVTTPGDRAGDTGDRHTASPDSTGQVTVVTGGGDSGDMTVVTQVTASLEQLRGDLADVLERVEELEGEREVSDHGVEQDSSPDVTSDTESDAAISSGHDVADEERGAQERSELVWWRRLAVLILMRVKMLAEWLARRIDK